MMRICAACLEAREEVLQRVLATGQERVHMAALRRAGPIERLGGQAVALEYHDTLEVIGERACRRQAAHAGAHDDHPPADVFGHPAYFPRPLLLKDDLVRYMA